MTIKHFMASTSGTVGLIIDAAVSSGGTVYGGFLRDYFADLAPSDIDIYFDGPTGFGGMEVASYPLDHYQQFIMRLVTILPIKISKEPGSSNYAFPHARIHSVELKSFGLSHIDCVLGNPWLQDCDSSEDVDINMLYLNHAGLHVHTPHNGARLDVLSIVNACRNKTITRKFHTCSATRLAKMKAKGFIY